MPPPRRAPLPTLARALRLCAHVVPSRLCDPPLPPTRATTPTTEPPDEADLWSGTSDWIFCRFGHRSASAVNVTWGHVAPSSRVRPLPFSSANKKSPAAREVCCRCARCPPLTPRGGLNSAEDCLGATAEKEGRKGIFVLSNTSATDICSNNLVKWGVASHLVAIRAFWRFRAPPQKSVSECEMRASERGGRRIPASQSTDVLTSPPDSSFSTEGREGGRGDLHTTFSRSAVGQTRSRSKFALPSTRN